MWDLVKPAKHRRLNQLINPRHVHSYRNLFYFWLLKSAVWNFHAVVSHTHDLCVPQNDSLIVFTFRELPFWRTLNYQEHYWKINCMGLFRRERTAYEESYFRKYVHVIRYTMNCLNNNGFLICNVHYVFENKITWRPNYFCFLFIITVFSYRGLFTCLTH